MFNIVIIDDEPLSIRKLTILLEKCNVPVNILATASNGQEGLDIIHQYKPNLIFSDIQMPVLDGLEMIKTLRSSGCETPIVILSCHENFFYAKEAMKLGVYDYLLKDLLDHNNLKSLLSRLLTSNDQFKSSHTHQMTGINYQKALLTHLKKGSDSALDELSTFYSNLKNNDQAILFHIKLAFSSPFFNRNLSIQETDNLLTKINDKIDSNSISILLDKNIVILTKLHIGNSRLNYYNETQKFSNLLINILQKSETPPTFMISIGSPHHRREQLFREYSTILSTCNNILPSLHNPIIHTEDTKYTSNITYTYIDSHLENLSGIIDDCNRNGVHTILHKLFNDQENGFIQINYLNYIHVCLFSCLQQCFTRNKLEISTVFEKNHIPIEVIETFDHLEDIESWYFDKFSKIITAIEDKSKHDYSPKITETIKLIHKNPSISLAELSDQLNINKSYLSRLFKKEVGQNVSDYTINTRINLAKKYLAETSMKVNDIAEKLGYIYPHQFSKDFKRQTNQIPTEYRRQQQ